MTIQALFARSTTLAALLMLPLGIAPAAAQESNAAQKQSKAGEVEGATGGPDAVIVTVGDSEIFGSDVMRAIGMLPPTMRQQPVELLLPAALQQLVLRELILDRARSENLAEDPNYASMAEQASAEAKENVTVQFWLQREMANAVSDEAVNAAYEQFTQSAQGEVPPLDAVRPQIEQELRRREMNQIRADLQAKGPEITFASQGQQQSSSSDGSFCTASYAPGGDTAQQTGSEFAEMDLDGDGMVSQQEYQQCRTAAAE